MRVNQVADKSSDTSSCSGQEQLVLIKELNIFSASDSPLLAIIIPCWNYENYVARAIRSVLSQAEAARCELVVIDDGSTDGSWEVIRHEGVKAYRITNSGARLACLFGVDQTTAPFVLFLDADDELAPGSLAKILSLLDPTVAKLQFSLTQIDQDGQIIGKAAPKLGAFRSRQDVAESVLRMGGYASPPTSGNVFRRDVCEYLRTAQYDPFVDGIILFISPFVGDIVSLSEELGRYRIHGRNHSGLGGKLNPVLLRRELRRFVDRMGHLRQVLETFHQSYNLVRAEHTFFFLERRFFLEVAEGRRIRIKHLKELLKQLWRDPFTLKQKIVLTLFLLSVAASPSRFAQGMIAFRLDSSRRSLLNIVS